MSRVEEKHELAEALGAGGSPMVCRSLETGSSRSAASGTPALSPLSFFPG